jgi:hypothetical protein
VTPDQKNALILAALSGQSLNDWFPGGNTKAAISHVVSSFAGGSWGQVEHAGIRGAAGTIPWREGVDVIRKGSRGGNRERYLEAQAAYVEQATKPLPHPWRPGMGADRGAYFQDPENLAHCARAVGRPESSSKR